MASSILEKPSAGRERDREVTRRPDYNYGSGYAPFSMLRRFTDEMDRFFDRAGNREAWTPAVEVRERNGNIEVIAELPGLKKDDIKVECTDDGIILEGEKREEHEETQGGMRRTERSYGRFYRLIPLPSGAEPDKASAEFRNGLLVVRVPVQENKQRRRPVPIEA